MTGQEISKNLGELVTVEYSPRQGCYHIETLTECVENNQATLRGIADGESGYAPADFIPIAICRNEPEAGQFLREWKMATRLWGSGMD